MNSQEDRQKVDDIKNGINIDADVKEKISNANIVMCFMH